MILNIFRYPAAPNPEHRRLIFLHGLGGTGSLWRPVAASLEEEFQLMCPDQRGHGKSIPSAEDWKFSVEDYARDVRETAEAQGFSPAWVIGHSMGCRTAVGYAKLEPQSVDGLVLIDLGFEGFARGGVSDFIHLLPERFASRAEARTFMEQNCPDPSIGQYLIAVSKTEADGSITFPFSHDALIRTAEAGQPTRNWGDVENFARTTGKPVHILRGERSRVYTKDEFERDRARGAGLANVHFHEFAGAGHGLPFEKRLEVVARLREWVAMSPSAR